MERNKNLGHLYESSENLSLTLEKVAANEPLVQKAFDFAKEVHKNQIRDDGVTPYFSHLEATARIAVEELGINDPTFIAACFLHDSVEDSGISLDQIKTDFGPEVADLVDGVTQIRYEITEESGSIPSKAERDRQNEKKVFHKSFFSPKVGILKAACDRLHNMRTLDTAREDKRERKAKETIIYARLLESLGIWQKMIELEDLSFYYTDKKAYLEFEEMVRLDPRTSQFERDHMVSRLESILEREGIKAQINYKLNGLLRLKNKMEEKTPEFKDINDVITYTIIAGSVSESFQILSFLRSEFAGEEDVKRFDDFLSYPTDNGYSALQMTIITPRRV